jgi:hypothetical protein
MRLKLISALNNEDEHLAVYYDNMIKQFETVYEKLQELPGEKREAHLIMAMN